MSRTSLANIAWVLSILIALAGLCLFIYTTLGGNVRALSPWSKLEPYEEGITAVSDEFMRRSPRLKKNYDEFEMCMRFRDCVESDRLFAILAKRDQIIHEEWPAIFDRLIITGDWAVKKKPITREEVETLKAYSNFQKKLTELGPEKMRNACEPIIYFWMTSVTYQPAYGLDRHNGYRCSDVTPPRHSSGR